MTQLFARLRWVRRTLQERAEDNANGPRYKLQWRFGRDEATAKTYDVKLDDVKDWVYQARRFYEVISNDGWGITWGEEYKASAIQFAEYLEAVIEKSNDQVL